jgi:ethanolamine utilization protein EutN
MIIARVLDTIVASQKHHSHNGQKILLVQPLALDGEDSGEPVVAIDAVSAGIGDRVLVVQEGFAAMTSVGRPESPIDASVIGVIDAVDIEEIA